MRGSYVVAPAAQSTKLQLCREREVSTTLQSTHSDKILIFYLAAAG